MTRNKEEVTKNYHAVNLVIANTLGKPRSIHNTFTLHEAGILQDSGFVTQWVSEGRYGIFGATREDLVDAFKSFEGLLDSNIK